MCCKVSDLQGNNDCSSDIMEHTECWWGMALAGGTPYRPLRCEE